MAAVWSNVKGVPPAPDCPCIALASCLARAAYGLTDPHVHAQTTSEFLRQPELSAPVGGRAFGRRSGGSLFFLFQHAANLRTSVGA